MKKLIILLGIMVLAVGLFAGGKVTNLNQSAEYVRTLNRNASTELDATFYNPAGLSKLEDGLYVYLSNQSIMQVKGVDANYDVDMNRTNFEGTTGVWFYPNLYLAAKIDKLTISGGFAPIGGGGSAEYKDGLPSFEEGIASIPLIIGADDYQYEVSFEGSSVYYGLQAGVTYEINDEFSVYGGVRFVNAVNSYEGYLEDILVSFDDGASFTDPGPYLDAVSSALDGYAALLQSAIDAGYGEVTLADLQAAGGIDATSVALLEGGLESFGVDATGYTVQDVQNAYYGTSEVVSTAADAKDLETDRTGHGFCGIIGINWSPNEDLNIGFRYESITKMDMKNDTKVNTTGVETFDDGEEFGSDMPALIALGISYRLNEKWRLESSANYFFDENVDWDGKEDDLENAYEFGLAVEYNINEQLLASIGGLYTSTAATKAYRTDLDYGLDSFTLGLGMGYKFSDQLKLDLGAMNAFYFDDENADGSEEYYKTTTVVSLGMSYKF